VLNVSVTFAAAAPESFTPELMVMAAERIAAAAGIPAARVTVLAPAANQAGGVVIDAILVFEAEAEAAQVASFTEMVRQSASAIFPGAAFDAFAMRDEGSAAVLVTTFGDFQQWPVLEGDTAEGDSQGRLRHGRSTVGALVAVATMVLMAPAMG